MSFHPGDPGDEVKMLVPTVLLRSSPALLSVARKSESTVELLTPQDKPAMLMAVGLAPPVVDEARGHRSAHFPASGHLFRF